MNSINFTINNLNGDTLNNNNPALNAPPPITLNNLDENNNVIREPPSSQQNRFNKNLSVNLLFNDGSKIDMEFPPNLNIWYTNKYDRPIFDDDHQVIVDC
jgi:hypothetical protein